MCRSVNTPYYPHYSYYPPPILLTPYYPYVLLTPHINLTQYCWHCTHVLTLCYTWETLLLSCILTLGSFAMSVQHVSQRQHSILPSLSILPILSSPYIADTALLSWHPGLKTNSHIWETLLLSCIFVDLRNFTLCVHWIWPKLFQMLSLMFIPTQSIPYANWWLQLLTFPERGPCLSCLSRTAVKLHLYKYIFYIYPVHCWPL